MIVAATFLEPGVMNKPSLFPNPRTRLFWGEGRLRSVVETYRLIEDALGHLGPQATHANKIAIIGEGAAVGLSSSLQRFFR